MDRAASCVVDGSDDVIAGGLLTPSGLSPAGTVVKLDGDTGAEIWSYSFQGTAGGSDDVQDVHVDASGDVLASGSVYNDGPASPDFIAVKLDGDLGTELWRLEADGGVVGGLDWVTSSATDTSGNLYLAGPMQLPATVLDATVVKVDGITGAESWRTHLVGGTNGFFDEAWAVTVDAAGNPCVAMTVDNLGSGVDMGVACLDATTGSELWRQVLNGTDNSTDMPYAITADTAGAVIAVGTLDNTLTSFDMVVAKYAGLTGTELWRVEIDGADSASDSARSVALDPSGDVLVAGTIWSTTTGERDLAVVKLDGSSGVEQWRTTIDGTAADQDEAQDVTIDAAGDVLVTGYLESTGSARDFVVIKIAGATGAELWRREFDGSASALDSGNSVSVDSKGRVVAAGILANTGLAGDFTVLKLNGTDGTDYVAPILIGGKKLKIKDKATDPSKRKVLFLLKDALVVPPAPGSAGDPTVGGAVLRLLNPGTLEEDTFSLPSSGWVGLGKPAGAKGYKYRDAELANGPCKVALVKSGKAKTVCKGSQIAFSLDEPSQGAVGVGLALGGAPQLCTEFGGDIKKDIGAAGGSTGLFKAQDAPAPTSCAVD